ncbi:MAG: ABC transporter permease [Chloroherpetonaceae bacterium]|nr:ABC transporter permease [Chloroherpetonaceae bacterium]
MSQIVIDANKRFSLNIGELFEYRELLWMLAYRDIKIRYAQTVLGVLWALIQPLTTLVIFTLVFSRVVKVDTSGVPYTLFALSGMSLWGYFSAVMSQAGSSVIGAQNIVKKIYFPRLIIPLSKAISAFVDFGITLLFLFGMMLYHQYVPSANAWWIPFFILATIFSGLGIGIWLSALTIRYRDLQYVLPFAVQLGTYASPVAYPSSLVPEQYHAFYYLNPMAGMIDGMRWAMFGSPINGGIFISFAVAAFLFVTGYIYFRKIEGEIADIV